MAAPLGRLIVTQRTQQTAADGIPLACLGRVARAFGPGIAPTGPRGGRARRWWLAWSSR